MNNLPEPTYTIELDLPTVAKQGLYLTIFAFISLFSFNLLVHKLHEFSFSFTTFLWNTLLFSIGYLLLIILHEFFHLLGFRVFSKVPWRKMKVGVNLKLGIAYATTPQLMTNRAIRKSLLLPFWMTGVIPAIIGLYLDNNLLIALAALLIGGASGDFSMYRQLKKIPNDWLIQDHPTKPKLRLYNPTELPR